MFARFVHFMLAMEATIGEMKYKLRFSSIDFHHAIVPMMYMKLIALWAISDGYSNDNAHWEDTSKYPCT